MIANSNGDNDWKKCEQATCSIQSADLEDNVYTGTGFLYGNGWVISVAHNFQNDNTDREQQHSLLSRAHFTFTVNGQRFDFPRPPRNRMALINHLRPGNNIDPNNMDIAMVKLGIQYEYMRSKNDYEPWEKTEQQNLKFANYFCYNSKSRNGTW